MAPRTTRIHPRSAAGRATHSHAMRSPSRSLSKDPLEKYRRARLPRLGKGNGPQPREVKKHRQKDRLDAVEEIVRQVVRGDDRLVIQKALSRKFALAALGAPHGKGERPLKEPIGQIDAAQARLPLAGTRRSFICTRRSSASGFPLLSSIHFSRIGNASSSAAHKIVIV